MRRSAWRVARRRRSSYSAKAEYPVRRGLSIPSLTPRNTGSPAFAGDDGWPAQFRILAAQFTRGLPKRFAPQESEGAGNAGCALHPRSRVQNCAKKRTRAYRFSGGHPTFPAQWLYGLLRDLPGVSGFLASVAFEYGTSAPGRADLPPKDLTPTTEASGPHDFTVRNSTVRQRAV